MADWHTRAIIYQIDSALFYDLNGDRRRLADAERDKSPVPSAINKETDSFKI